jgi:hypothetical protein
MDVIKEIAPAQQLRARKHCRNALVPDNGKASHLACLLWLDAASPW